MVDMVPNKWELGARRASGGNAGLRVYPGAPTRGRRAMWWDFPLRRQTHQMATVVQKYQACTKANSPARTYLLYMTTMCEARYGTMIFYTTYWYIFMFHFMLLECLRKYVFKNVPAFRIKN